MTSSRVTMPAAPSARSRASSSGLAGRRPDLVAARRRGSRPRTLPTPPLAPVTRTGPSPGAQAARLDRGDGHRRGEPGRPDRHRLARGQAGRQRHDVAGRQARVLAVAAVPRDAEVVAVGEDRVARRRTSGDDDATTSPARSMPGNDRADPGDLAVGDRREPVLVVDARPIDADLDLAVGQVGGGERRGRRA